MTRQTSVLTFLQLSLLCGCSVWASNGEYEFVDAECAEDLECSAAAFATPTCEAGRCDLECDATHADCDDQYSTGCEADLESVASCGACGNACEAPMGNMPTCEAGQCVVECNATEFLECDMDPANGCEVNGTTLSNCGECGRACNDGEFCRADGDVYDCAITCDDTVCGDNCVVTTENRLNCGSCGNVCGNDNTQMPSTCDAGTCTVVCAEGFDDCDGDPSNGCETPLDTSANCGACDMECSNSNANPVCDVSGAAPVCIIVDCTDGYQDCNVNAADGCEANTDMDVDNCGGCGDICGSENTSIPSQCSAGSCVLTCDTNFADCDMDGATGCEAPTETLMGCGVCAPGRMACDGVINDGCEVNVLSDPNHCGRCGDLCPSGICTDGTCRGAADVGVSWDHSCVLYHTGEVYCTGRNSYGESGRPPNTSVLNPTQVLLEDMTPLSAMAIGVGEDHSCVIDSTGHLLCWGRGTDLRTGHVVPLANGYWPAPVEAEETETEDFAERTFVRLATSLRHSCAIDELGGVWCWGNGLGGALGTNDDTDRRATRVLNLEGLGRPATDVFTGFMNSAVLLDDGRIYAWGKNDFGQLGVDPATNSSLLGATRVFAGVAVKDFSLGFEHTCFIEMDDTLSCVGLNDFDRLGTTGGNTFVPRVVPLASTPLSVHAGTSNTCALTTSGVTCWGRNADGELGVGSFSISSLPMESVVFPPGVVPDTLVRSGYYNTCVLAGPIPYCWGSNLAENLSTNEDDWTLTARPEDAAGAALPLVSISVGTTHGCGATATELYCWGGDPETVQGMGSDAFGTFAHLPRTVPLPMGVTSVTGVAAGGDHTCFLGDDGNVYCGGSNNLGEHGLPPNPLSRTPRLAPLPVSVDEVVASRDLTCARSGTSVYCFGASSSHGASMNRDVDRITGGGDVTTPLPGITDAVALTAGHAFGCALRSTGGVYCWGWDNGGQRGDGADDDGQVNLPLGAVRVEAGFAHACAVLTDGGVYCWGNANFGRLGNGVTSGTYPDPVPVLDAMGPITGAIDVAVNEISSCALRADGTLLCWGGSRWGTAGDYVSSPLARVHPGISDATSLEAGSEVGSRAICFMRDGSDGAGPVGCVGSRNDGRIGAASSNPRVGEAMRYIGLPQIDEL